ncbi:putative bifunctional diguanylate cyclase/phosphodiesterase [Kinneretia aquatilis]|uniref:putative bifunctional diguanylate cyclase/phosphodiesterase n=1 Tax=Kinneretia aquatilis TaxID=2070761 RepID=UPI001495229E|nr:bifunctional diguanylate cyclase/phosphodiesterase [Paucibacter aquatile]WIW00064.1 bifunctional diguanylate cyclase/phosphodiesterase [Paucibacter aquatile]
MSLSSPSVLADAHRVAFRQVWLARYGSPGEAQALAEQYLAEAGDDQRLILRMQLVQRRLDALHAGAGEPYRELAVRMQALGDVPGSLIAQSMALGAENFGGDAAGALAAYEQLSDAIYGMQDPLEQHAAMGSSLVLYQAAGDLVGYMQQACRMLQLTQEIDHSGMRSAALSNLGIAFFLAGDELQARIQLEQAVASNELGGWVRFGAVTILAEIYASAGDFEKVMPLLRMWSFPSKSAGLDSATLAHFHVLGAEVFASLGQVEEAVAYLDFLTDRSEDQHSHDLLCLLAMARAMVHQAAGRPAETAAATAEALRLVQTMPRSERTLAPRFWSRMAELVSTQGHWEQAYGLIQRYRLLDQAKKRDMAAVRRVAAQCQLDASTRAIEAAQRDRLTGLGNRERLIAVGDSWIARGLAPHVAMLNVRRFNAINQALGQDIGDAVLQAVAERLSQVCIRFDHALAGRVYADQFVLVLAGEAAELADLQAMASDLFATPLQVAGQWVDISTAWGLSYGPDHGSTMHRLMSHAEIALHEGRRSDASWTVYEPSLVRADPLQLSLISELKRAAQDDEFTLLVQPKFRLVDNAVTSFESLIRWNHPSRGLVPPVDFIPFAESTGNIRGITEWVLRRAMLLSAQLRQAGLVSQIAVNVSVHDVGSAAFPATLSELLNATGARAEDIRLELTEGAVMKDPATVIDRMREINAQGFEWSVDDFGTGQSSLAYLHMLPVSELKIDRSFVRGAAGASTTLTLLKAAIDLGRNLGLATVGEGAETEEEWALLRQLGCTTAQGWYGARPMPEQGLLSWLQGGAPLAGG